MKWLYAAALSIVGIFALAVGDAPAPQLANVQTVYILPMGGGMDQYLASRLTAMHVVQVAADPQDAGWIFTDRLGDSFERKLADLYPKPAPPKPEADKDKEADKPLRDISHCLSPGLGSSLGG